MRWQSDGRLIRQELSAEAEGRKGRAVDLLTLDALLLEAKASEASPVQSPVRPQAGEPGEGELLSLRELEVLGLLARGLRNKEIGSRLCVSLSTVKTHVCHVYQKLSVQTRTQAVRRAQKLGLVQP